MEQLGSQQKNCNESLYINTFRKSAEKIPGSLKSNMNNGYFTWRPKYVFGPISLGSSYNEKCFQTKFAKKIKAHFYVQ